MISQDEVGKRCPLYARGDIPKVGKSNIAWRKKVLAAAKGSKSVQREIRKACASDLLFYINGFVFIMEPREGRRIPFSTWPYQDSAMLEIVESIQVGKDLVIEKSRDMGASWMCLAVMEWLWHFHDLQTFLLLSKKEEDVDKRGNYKALFQKIDFIHNHLPGWLRPKMERLKLHLGNLDNGSTLDGESTNEFAGVADRRRAVLLDEFSKMENQEVIFRGLRDVTRCRISNFTPNGPANLAAQLAQDPRFRKLTLHWSINPVKRVGLYRGTKDGVLEKLVPEGGYADEKLYRRDGKLRSPWYDNECDRCVDPREIAQELDIDYQGSSSRYFEESLIQRAILDSMVPIRVGFLEYERGTARPIRFVDDPGGNLLLWFNPDAAGRCPTAVKYGMGVDISAGTGLSNSCTVCADVRTGEQVAELTTPHMRPEDFAEYNVALALWLNEAYMVWEAPGPGRQFGDRVVELGYGNFHYRRNETSLKNQPIRIAGWYPTKDDRRAIYGSYRKAIEDGRFVVRSKIQLEECRSIVFNPDNSIVHVLSKTSLDPSGAKENHGDRPTAGSLCWKALEECGEKVVSTARALDDGEIEYPYGSLGWRMQEVRQDELAARWW